MREALLRFADITVKVSTRTSNGSGTETQFARRTRSAVEFGLKEEKAGVIRGSIF